MQQKQQQQQQKAASVNVEKLRWALPGTLKGTTADPPTQTPCDPQHPRPRSQWAWTWTWAWATVARARTADQFWDMNMAFFESHMKRPTTADRRTGQIGCGIYHKNAQGTGYWILDGGFWMRGTGSSVQGFGFLLSGRASRGGDNNTCATTAVAAKITGQWS